MITVIHGDNTVASRNQLNQLVTQTKQQGVKDVVRLDGKKLDPTSLKQALESHSLFGTDRLVIIEDLFKRQTSKAKTNLLKYLKESTVPTDTIIWESKLLTLTQLKSLGSPKQLSFKITKTLFNFLDSLKPGQPNPSLKLLQATIQTDTPELIFAMLIRQNRLLIQIKANTPTKLAPWQANKLRSQASFFTQNQLLSLHKKLLNLDISIKTGNNLLSLEQSLDTLVSTL